MREGKMKKLQMSDCRKAPPLKRINKKEIVYEK